MTQPSYVDTLDPLVSPAFEISPAAPQSVLKAGKGTICVYNSAEEMGTATAISIAAHQCRLVEEKGHTSIFMMAAPSAQPFYEAYIRLVHLSSRLQAALRETHFFHFDVYLLPANHPASFRFFLTQNFFAPLARFCDPHKVHLLNIDQADPERACREYTRMVMEAGPDLQVKGTGENGHWGYHEPGVPLEGEPAFVRAELGPINIAQQVRDHPWLYPSVDRVPRVAWTANVPLFMRTKCLIEDNVPQASKAFAVLAAYGNDNVHSTIPSSKAKEHDHLVVRTTMRAAWALIEYRRRGVVSKETLEQFALDFRQTPEARSFMLRAFDKLDIKYKK